MAIAEALAPANDFIAIDVTFDGSADSLVDFERDYVVKV